MSSPTTNQITNTSQVSGVTLTDVLNALRVTVGDGSGDMVRAVYDTDNDGKVDVANVAEAVPWTGVTGKPTLFPAQPYTHNHAISEVTGLQSALDEKQETLVSGDNIKSVNGSSLLGSGNIIITSGVTDHGTLTGLTDDDHTQYHNDARGDARYSLLSHVHAAATTSVAGFMSSTDKTKLNGIADGATANSSDATLLNRANHTGTQAQSTITGLTAAIASAVGGNAANNIGYLNIPQNSQSAAYTCVLADAGKHVLHPSADTTARTFTIPANSSVAFPIGTAITFVNQNSAGVVTIAITTDTMRLAGAGTTGSRTLAANGVATATKITATEWIISGVGLT